MSKLFDITSLKIKVDECNICFEDININYLYCCSKQHNICNKCIKKYKCVKKNKWIPLLSIYKCLFCQRQTNLFKICDKNKNLNCLQLRKFI